MGWRMISGNFYPKLNSTDLRRMCLKFFGSVFMAIYAYGSPHDDIKPFVYDSLVNQNFRGSCGAGITTAI